MSDKTTEPTEAEKAEAALDEAMAQAFGTNVDVEEHPGVEELIVPFDQMGTDEEEALDDDNESEEEESEDTEEDDDEEEDLDDDESEEEDDEEDDDSSEDDESDGDVDDSESEDGEANTDEGDGADETLSDGQLALDMMIDDRLAAYKAPSDDFDPATVGTEAEYIEDAKEVFGDGFDEDYVQKMGKANFKSAMRRATKAHEAGTEARTETRRDADTHRLVAQSNALKNRVGDKEVQRVAKRMAVIYQAKVDATSLDAANTIPVEVYFRRAGGRITAPKQKGKGKPGVATQQAKAQKRKAVVAQKDPTQVGTVRKPGKRGPKQDQAVSELQAHLNSQSNLDSLLFGD